MSWPRTYDRRPEQVRAVRAGRVSWSALRDWVQSLHEQATLIRDGNRIAWMEIGELHRGRSVEIGDWVVLRGDRLEVWSDADFRAAFDEAQG